MQKMQESQVGFLDQEDPLEEEMQLTTVFLPGEIPWKEKSGGIQFMGLQRIRHD